MKKLLSCLIGVLLCVSMVCPAFAAAADDTFVPSIGYKGNPDIVPVLDEDGNPHLGAFLNDEGDIIGYLDDGCLVVTSVAEAETSQDIPAAARDLLLDVYAKLMSGEMELPYGEGLDASSMVIRDLFDVSWLCAEHPEMLEPVGVTLQLTFKVNVDADADVTVMTYKNGAWGDIVSVTNNGDNTVTCVFEDFCPVAFAVPMGEAEIPPTGDNSQVVLWTVLMVASAAVLVGLVVVFRRKGAAK